MEEIEMLRGRMCYQNHQLKVRWATSVRDISHKVCSRVGFTLIELLTSKHICIIVLVSLIVAATAAIGQKEEEVASLIAKGITMLREGEFKLYPVDITALAKKEPVPNDALRTDLLPPKEARSLLEKELDKVVETAIAKIQPRRKEWAQIMVKMPPEMLRKGEPDITKSREQSKQQFDKVMTMTRKGGEEKTTPGKKSEGATTQGRSGDPVWRKCRPYEWESIRCWKLAPADVNEVWAAPISGCVHVKEGALYNGGAAGGAAVWFSWKAPSSGTLTVKMHTQLQGRQSTVCAGWWAYGGTYAAIFVKIVDSVTGKSAEGINWDCPGSFVCRAGYREFKCPSNGEVSARMDVVAGRTYYIGGGMVANAVSAGVGMGASNFYVRICDFELRL
jgi:hypothetical protein